MLADDLLTGADLVRQVICSLDGGYNGLEPNKKLGIKAQEDGTILYTLTDPDGNVESFIVAITPVESVEPEPVVPEPDEVPE